MNVLALDIRYFLPLSGDNMRLYGNIRDYPVYR